MDKPKILKAASHLTVWLLFFTLIVSVATSMRATTFAQQLSSAGFFIFCLIYLFIFYINSTILFPYLYLKKKYFTYFIIFLALGAGVFVIRPFDKLVSEHRSIEFRPPPPHNSVEERRPPHAQPLPQERRPRQGPSIDIVSMILFLMVWFAGMALQILKEWRSSQQKALIAESDKKTAELAFLKAHINPHFLFNTLNNIYSLAIINHEQTAVSILKLSNIMRYVTESVTTEFIALENEVECIIDYVDLQKLRLSKKVYLDFSITGNSRDKVIAPLILMTFIENIFKYGISNHHQSTITIKLFIEEKTITFYCQNKIFNPDYTYDREGFGIANTRRRLNFLYPDKHKLDINTDKDLYTVQLTLYTA